MYLLVSEPVAATQCRTHGSAACTQARQSSRRLGDLNFRVDLPRQSVSDEHHGAVGKTAVDDAKRSATLDSEELAISFRQALLQAHVGGGYEHLLRGDQLRVAQASGRAFATFSEGKITFPPTFKVAREPSISYVTSRLPAWCDRVLWHSNLPEELRPRCTAYKSIAACDSSDHKPVVATLEVPSVLSPAQVVTDDVDRASLCFTCNFLRNCTVVCCRCACLTK